MTGRLLEIARARKPADLATVASFGMHIEGTTELREEDTSVIQIKSRRNRSITEESYNNTVCMSLRFPSLRRKHGRLPLHS